MAVCCFIIQCMVYLYEICILFNLLFYYYAILVLIQVLSNNKESIGLAFFIGQLHACCQTGVLKNRNVQNDKYSYRSEFPLID